MSASLKPARISHCEQKLACLQFDFSVVNTVGDDFAQEVPSGWHHRPWDNDRSRFTAAVIWRKVEREAILIFAYILYLKPEYLFRGASGGGSECGNRISDANLIIVSHGNYGSVLLSFKIWPWVTQHMHGLMLTDDGSHCISGQE